jgi:hypothetical protein
MFIPHRKHTYTYGPPRPVTGKVLRFICRCSYRTGNTPTGLNGLLLGYLYFLYVDVRTAQETPTHTGLHGLLPGKFYVLYVDVRTAQETHLQASAACYWDIFIFIYRCSYRTGNTPTGLHTCYGDIFTFLYVDVRTAQETPTGTRGLYPYSAFTALSYFVCTSARWQHGL